MNLRICGSVNLRICESTNLPFKDIANYVAMIRHSMDVVKQAVLRYSKSWSGTHHPYRSTSAIVMFYWLHIEIAAFKTLGDLLEGSGWTGALVQARVATPGTVDAFLKASHVTRTRRSHQITASSLYLLLQKAYVH